MGDPRQPHRLEADGPEATYAAADLPIDDHGNVYHIQIQPGQLAPDILLVGDPGRASLIGSKFLRDVEFECEHRGLVTITGTSHITGDQTTIITPARRGPVSMPRLCPMVRNPMMVPIEPVCRPMIPVMAMTAGMAIPPPTPNKRLATKSSQNPSAWLKA